MATAGMSPMSRRRPSSRPTARWSCATSQRIRTGRCTISPAYATPVATSSESCRIRSAATRRSSVVRTAPASSSLWRLAMRRSTLAICALLMVATFGCDQVNAAKEKLKTAWDRVRGRQTATHTPPPPVRPAPDTAAARIAAAQQQQRAQHPPPPTRPEGMNQAPTRDVPYVSADSGTVAPGMSEREVYEIWGSPAAVRRAGEYTYLFFRNGCEYTCGTMDVVTLQTGKVVDAIVRWDGHKYSGESSSPPGRVPFANPGGDTLR